MRKTAVIVGAGPAGLTTAFELLKLGAIKPLIFEVDSQVGGISKTINHHGNRMDIGGHRFFSKSDWVMQWWQRMLPMETRNSAVLTYQGQKATFTPQNHVPADPDAVMLVRSRLSRIFYRRRFFDYPLKLNWKTFKNLGLFYAVAVGMSYLRARLSPRTPEASLEDFLYNRFGDKLYRTFFKDYTEKVWGVSCSEISAEWGAQRIKGLSIGKALKHALINPFRRKDTRQKDTETSLIERFLYPKFGPGQMWEETAALITRGGGEVHLRQKVIDIHRDGYRIVAVDVCDEQTGDMQRLSCDYLVSTMPIKELVNLLRPEDPEVARIAAALPYRNFMTVGLLVHRMKCKDPGVAANGMPPDNWIYIQEPDVKLGRLQIFNNWSPSLVADPGKIWLGLEYFCDEGDTLWSMSDAAFLKFAVEELERIGLIERQAVLDGTVVRVPKAYPAYFGEYRSIGTVRNFLDRFENLFPVGRNGMHRYNNQDHSMLAAKAAVDCIANGSADKRNIWSINAEEDYHEEKTG